MGYGPRYNLEPQQPEEGYSNFLWVVVCTLIEYLELDITFWAPMLGFACGSLLLYLVFRTLRRDFGMGLGVAVPIALGLGLFPPYALWSTGGLGTMAFALSAFATAYFILLRPAGIAPYRGALAGIAMALLRTEGIAWTLLIALLGIVTRRMKREAVWATGGRLCRDRWHRFFQSISRGDIPTTSFSFPIRSTPRLVSVPKSHCEAYATWLPSLSHL